MNRPAVPSVLVKAVKSMQYFKSIQITFSALFVYQIDLGFMFLCVATLTYDIRLCMIALAL
jgi:hypothetical protein